MARTNRLQKTEADRQTNRYTDKVAERGRSTNKPNILGNHIQQQHQMDKDNV